MGLYTPRRPRLLALPGVASTLALFLPLLILLSSAQNTAVTASPDADSRVIDIPPPPPPPLADSADEREHSFIRNWVESMLKEGGVIGDGLMGEGDGSQPRMYEPDFGIFDRSILGRAPPGVTSLANNVPEQLNVDPGSTQVFVFEMSTISSRGSRGSNNDISYNEELRKRDEDNDEGNDEEQEEGDADYGGEEVPRLKRRANNSTTVYFSANTCIQPQLLSTTDTGDAPQLTMYVSTSAENISPGPDSNSSKQTWHVFNEGAVMVSVNTTEDVYIGISAPNISTTTLSGIYNFQLAASVDDWYYSYDNETDANLIWVDSDSSASLLITHNLTDSKDAAAEESIMATEPYVMFAQNVNDRSTNGVRFSYCGLQTYAQIAATKNGKFTSMVTTSMTKTGLGNLPKQQFYFSGLNASSSYSGILAALPQNGTGVIGDNVVGGGGKVSRATSFQTKAANANCEVVFNLTFCNETAYAVPSNPTRFADATELARVYDEYASNMFGVFQKVLAQIPCEAPDTQRYSLARDCSDCEAAYKNWLCSVAMPRCADFSDNSTWLQPRAISQPFPSGDFLDADIAAQYPNISAYNSSRNPFIDETIAPGPYKEVLPCDDLCYSLVQSCPSAIGFSCPLPGYIGFNTSYRQRTAADEDGQVMCNYPGSAHYFSAGPTGPRWSNGAIVVAVVGSLFVLFMI